MYIRDVYAQVDSISKSLPYLLSAFCKESSFQLGSSQSAQCSYSAISDIPKWSFTRLCTRSICCSSQTTLKQNSDIRPKCMNSVSLFFWLVQQIDRDESTWPLRSTYLHYAATDRQTSFTTRACVCDCTCALLSCRNG